MARKGLVTLLLAVGMLAVGCGEKTAMVAPASMPVTMAATSVGSDLAAAWELGQTYNMLGSVSYTSVQDSYSMIGVGFKYFFEDVANDDKPVGLQEFFGSKTAAEAQVMMISPEVGDSDTAFGVDGYYTLPAMEGKMKVGAEVLMVSDANTFMWGINASYDFMAGLRATIGYSSTDYDGPVSSDISLDVRYAKEIAGKWLDATLALDSYGSDDEGMQYGVTVDYYLMKELAVRVGYQAGSDNYDASTISAGAAYYTGPLAIKALWENTSPDVGDDKTAISVVVEYRM